EEGEVDHDRQQVEGGEVDGGALDPHPGGEGDQQDDHGREQPADEGADRVARDHAAAPRRGEHQAAGEPVLEVAGDAEAGEDPAERGRLEQDEAELEAGVAGRVVEAGNVPQPGEPAGERGEVEQREHQPGEEQGRVVKHVVDRPPGDRQRDVPEAPGGAHVRVILVRSASAEASRAAASRPAVIANASAIASPFQPSMIRARSPSIRYETGFTLASQRNQSASIRFRGKFIEERSRNAKSSGNRPCTDSPVPVRRAMKTPTAPKPIAIAIARASRTTTPPAPEAGCTSTA